MHLILLLIGLAVLLSLVMMAAWAVILRTGKSGWADAFWTGSIGLGGIAAALVPLATEPATPRHVVVAALVAFWSFRLASHIARRTLKGEDDPRYAQLRKEWGEDYRRRLFGFLQIQAGAAFVLVTAVLAASLNPNPLGIGDASGVVIAIAAIIGEGISDSQLTAFKRDPANKGKVCDIGLWSLSRHPNYFFEWLYWLAFVPIGISFVGYPWGWITLIAPAMMYWLLVHVSGVPLLEAHMLRSRGDAFRAYQARVRAFWPIPKGNS